MCDIWKTKIPLKIQAFLWMLWHDRAQTAKQLKKKKLGWINSVQTVWENRNQRSYILSVSYCSVDVELDSG